MGDAGGRASSARRRRIATPAFLLRGVVVLCVRAAACASFECGALSVLLEEGNGKVRLELENEYKHLVALNRRSINIQTQQTQREIEIEKTPQKRNI